MSPACQRHARKRPGPGTACVHDGQFPAAPVVIIGWWGCQNCAMCFDLQCLDHVSR
jgi:hypothetical protein